MLLAQNASVRTRDMATADYEFRMGFASQVSQRRKELGYTLQQLAESANISVEDLILVERGDAFDGGHDAAVNALSAIERLESIRSGKANLRLV